MHGPIEMPHLRQLEIHIPQAEERGKPVEHGIKAPPVELTGTPEQLHLQKVQLDLEHGISSVDIKSLKLTHDSPTAQFAQLADAITKNLTEKGAVVRYDQVAQAFKYSDNTIKEAPVQINQFHRGPSIIGASPETLAALHTAKEFAATPRAAQGARAAAANLMATSNASRAPAEKPPADKNGTVVVINRATAKAPPSPEQIKVQQADAARIAAANQAEDIAAAQARAQAKDLQKNTEAAASRQVRPDNAPTEQANRPKPAGRLDTALEFSGKVGAKASQDEAAQYAKIAVSDTKVNSAERNATAAAAQSDQQAHVVGAALATDTGSGSNQQHQEQRDRGQADVVQQFDRAAKKVSGAGGAHKTPEHK